MRRLILLALAASALSIFGVGFAITYAKIESGTLLTISLMAALIASVATGWCRLNRDYRPTVSVMAIAAAAPLLLVTLVQLFEAPLVSFPIFVLIELWMAAMAIIGFRQGQLYAHQISEDIRGPEMILALQLILTTLVLWVTTM